MEKDIEFHYRVTIGYPVNKDGEILLQQKARGFGAGNWNGPGGKINFDETPEECVIREIEEETTLKMKKIKKVAELEFIFPEEKKCNNYCHVFMCDDFEGEPQNTGEGELRWFKKEEVPLDKMWDDDQYWLPDILNGLEIKRRFYFDDQGKVIKYEDIIIN